MIVQLSELLILSSSTETIKHQSPVIDSQGLPGPSNLALERSHDIGASLQWHSEDIFNSGSRKSAMH
jgi:hypothetical protein